MCPVSDERKDENEMKKPLFVTLGNEDGSEWPVVLLVRYPGDRDYFPWGEVTAKQHDTFEQLGVFDLDDADVSEV